MALSNFIQCKNIFHEKSANLWRTLYFCSENEYKKKKKMNTNDKGCRQFDENLFLFQEFFHIPTYCNFCELQPKNYLPNKNVDKFVPFSTVMAGWF